MNPAELLSLQMGLAPTDTVALKQRMKQSADSVNAELMRGERGIRTARKRNPNDPSLPPETTPDPMILLRAQSDTLGKARRGELP